MKIKVFKTAEIPEIVEKEVYFKFEDNPLSNHVGIILVDKYGVEIPSPFIANFGIDSITHKITLHRTGSVNPEFVDVDSDFGRVREV